MLIVRPHLGTTSVEHFILSDARCSQERNILEVHEILKEPYSYIGALVLEAGLWG